MYKLCVIIGIILLFLYSCNKKNDCSLADITCAAHTAIAFSVRAAETGTDLIFNSNPVYSTTELQLFSINKGDTTFYQHQAHIGFNGFRDSLILSWISYPWPQKIYIQLANEPVDSLALGYFSASVPCACPVFYIETLQLNRDTVMRDGKNLVILNK